MNKSYELKLKPKKFRLLFAFVLALGFTFIWSVYGSSRYFLNLSIETNFRDRLQSDTVILEDHLSRSLDTVATRLRSLAAFSSNRDLSAPAELGRKLYDLIQEDRVVRSISLVDSRGRILASSSPQNIGAVVPLGELPSNRAEGATSQVFYGKVYAFRDLGDISSDIPASSDLSFWLAATQVRISGQTYHWVAAINLGIFRNLWERSDEDPATEIAIYDYAGKRLASHHGYITEKAPIGIELMRQVASKDKGLFSFDRGQPFVVAYRVSNAHPVVMTITADMNRVFGAHASDRDRLSLYAITASIMLALLIFGAYRWYLRYEESIVEMQNQGAAINSHVMLSESLPDGQIISANPLFLQTTGYSIEEIQGQNHRMFNTELHPRRFYSDMWRTISSGAVWRGTFRNRKKNGDLYWVRTTIIPFKDAWGKVERYVAMYTDITEAMNAIEQVDHERRLRERLSQDNIKLQNDANTDPLTRLPNRRGMDVFVQKLMEFSKENASDPFPSLAAMMLDLDRFKLINDTYGHGAGDQVLTEVARRWSQQIRSSDLISRLGGEEFCVVLPRTSKGQAERIAEKLRAATCAEPIVVTAENGQKINLAVSVSIGLAACDGIEEDTMRSLLAKADKLLYTAKSTGRNKVVSGDLDTTGSL